MQEDLIGYLLGALEPDEMQRITDALRNDPALRAELERLQRMMKPLDQLDDIYEPPGDLVSWTMDNLPPLPPIPSTSDVGQEVTGSDLGLSGLGASANAGAGSVKPPSLRPVSALATDQGWRVADIAGMCAAVIVLAGLVLPGILRQRAAARVVACQDQLRNAGTALVQYLTRSIDGRFPGLEEEGPLSFSGMYAVELSDAGLIARDRPLWCSSLDQPQEWLGQPIPSRQKILQASPVELIRYQRGAGGHYAYSLGIFERGRYTAPRFQGRSGFAILADAPQQTLNGWTTAHEGKGFNILFEDGHVQFVVESEMWLQGDHPFLNRSGEMEAGLDPDDAALAPSQTPPFLPVGYRR